MSDTLRPVEEYPRNGTYTLEELRQKRQDLAECHRKYFPHLLDPVYRKMLKVPTG